MLPVKELPIDVKGLTPEMERELEERIVEFERDHEAQVSKGGEGYVAKIKKRDVIIAGTVNSIILLYYIFTVLL